MDWIAFITTILNKIPIDRVLFPPRDNAKALEEFTKTLPAPESQNKATSGQKSAPTIKTPESKAQPASTAVLERPATALLTEEREPPQLPTSEETRHVLKRRLAKELYRAELDLAEGLRIAGKPCDCLDSKHSLGLEAAAEELIPSEPDNQVYREILSWLQDNRPKLTIEAVSSGQYDDEYPKMAAKFKGFRKRIMGTTTTVTLEEAKKLAAEEAAKEVEKRWQSQEKK